MPQSSKAKQLLKNIVGLFDKDIACIIFGHEKPYFWGYEYTSNTKVEKCPYCFKRPDDGKQRGI